ncbi:hypothetical protein [Amycolatopsis sp. GM8]|uniref:hypothetical protein n=1 Tax=Amycolatopsis sp. GM8 TaxID=2896530 RepID=UPI001F1D19DB|nr:hypothetical protein [Amycolatopsis sp. GM8]
MTEPHLHAGGHTFTWQEGWAKPPDGPLGDVGWAHHALVVTGDGRVIGAQSGGAAVCFYALDGQLLGSWESGLTEIHGMALDGDRLWIADPALKAVPDGAGGYEAATPGAHGLVACFDLDGRRLRDLPLPDHPAYAENRYQPTAVVVADDGAIWVADGYGQSLVHRYSPDGTLTLTLTGEEGVGRFDCPHALFVDHRTDVPRLYVADRTNARLQVFGLDGAFLHSVTDGLNSPSAMVTYHSQLVVAELQARLAVFDIDDRLVGHLGEDDAAADRPGWPNAVAADGSIVRPPGLRPGEFNSPHGLAVDARGDLYVAEWLVGGRMVRLRRD